MEQVRHVVDDEVGEWVVLSEVLRRDLTDNFRLEIAWRAVPSAIERAKRAANARGDWNPDKLATIRVDARSPGERIYNPRIAGRNRREMIEALGDSNPPHMAEVIGLAILEAA